MKDVVFHPGDDFTYVTVIVISAVVVEVVDDVVEAVLVEVVVEVVDDVVEVVLVEVV